MLLSRFAQNLSNDAPVDHWVTINGEHIPIVSNMASTPAQKALLAAKQGAGVPKKISHRWINQQKGLLTVTAKDSPYREGLEKEISDAENELARRGHFEDWMKKKHGMVMNDFPVKGGGETHQPGKVFVSKDPVSKKVTGFMREGAAYDRYKQAEGI